MTIDFGGPMPSGVLILPSRRRQSSSPCRSWWMTQAARLPPTARIWHRDYPPQRLNSLVSALFAHNTHLTHLDYTFAGLPELKGVPESLFFPLDLHGLLCGRPRTKRHRVGGPATICRQPSGRGLLAGLPALSQPHQGPRGSLFGRRTGKKLQRNLCPKVGSPTSLRAFFANVRRRSSFVGTFARTPIRTVPSGLMHGLDPANVDGMFEPAAGLDHDPIKIKAGPAFPQDFFDDTRNAAGVPYLQAFLADAKKPSAQKGRPRGT